MDTIATTKQDALTKNGHFKGSFNNASLVSSIILEQASPTVLHLPLALHPLSHSESTAFPLSQPFAPLSSFTLGFPVEPEV